GKAAPKVVDDVKHRRLRFADFVGFNHGLGVGLSLCFGKDRPSEKSRLDTCIRQPRLAEMSDSRIRPTLLQF
ncbi:hypothetical protein, partial [Neisseria elongata]|uniref:hypothetical protein n=1 Tax=Neisseria elongata TaxID=495 RepID=UPI0024B0B2D1